MYCSYFSFLAVFANSNRHFDIFIFLLHLFHVLDLKSLMRAVQYPMCAQREKCAWVESQPVTDLERRSTTALFPLYPSPPPPEPLVAPNLFSKYLKIPNLTESLLSRKN